MEKNPAGSKRPLRLLAQAVLLVLCWVAIFEIGLRAQQYFGPLYDLELANVDLSWESDTLNHVPAAKNQHLCIYGDLTGTTYPRAFDTQWHPHHRRFGAALGLQAFGLGAVLRRFLHGGL